MVDGNSYTDSLIVVHFCKISVTHINSIWFCKYELVTEKRNKKDCNEIKT